MVKAVATEKLKVIYIGAPETKISLLEYLERIQVLEKRNSFLHKGPRIRFKDIKITNFFFFTVIRILLY